MNRYLFVIDYQNDFVDGALGFPGAEKLDEKIAAKVRAYGEGKVFFTRDTHFENYLETREGKNLPVPHCIKGTEGWQIARGLYVDGCRIIDKPNFGWPNWKDEALEDVELIGLCTDICVVSNALIIKAQFPNAEVTVDSACCAGVTPESHQAALTTMRMCQIDVK